MRRYRLSCPLLAQLPANDPFRCSKLHVDGLHTRVQLLSGVIMHGCSGIVVLPELPEAGRCNCRMLCSWPSDAPAADSLLMCQPVLLSELLKSN